MSTTFFTCNVCGSIIPAGYSHGCESRPIESEVVTSLEAELAAAKERVVEAELVIRHYADRSTWGGNDQFEYFTDDDLPGYVKAQQYLDKYAALEGGEGK